MVHYSQHFSIRLEGFYSDKHFSQLGHVVSYEENEALRICERIQNTSFS
jgi:hypothetical protein